MFAKLTLAKAPVQKCSLVPRSARAQDSTGLVHVEQSHFRKLSFGHLVDELRIGSAPTDYFKLLNVELDAGSADVRAMYKKLQRLVHPDLAGETATDLAAHINIAYATLSDPHARALYTDMVKTFRQEMGTFSGVPVSEWCGDESETRALFIDETLCIGCQQCAFSAPSTFFVEEFYGRARVAKQWADPLADITDAINLCPVACIHLVPRQEVALLEYVMKACKREDPAIVARRRCGNMSSSGGDNPFTRADDYCRKTTSTSHLRVEAATSHDHVLAAAIATAWKKLPHEVLVQGWPEYAHSQGAA